MSPQPLLPADKVLAVAAALRTDGKTPHLTHGTEDKPIQLGQTQIFAVRFEDGDTWAVRIPIHQDGTFSPSSIADLAQDEVDTLTKLNEAGFRWAPKLIGSDCSFDNPLGRPYMVVNWLPGVALEWSSALAAEKRQKVLRQLADIQLDLAQCTSEPRSSDLAQRHLMDIIGSKVSRVMNGTLPEVDLRSCFVLRALVRKAVRAESPIFSLTHSNLAAHKIIVDSDYNITGVVDWKLARFRPLEVALKWPRLLAVGRDVADSSSPKDNTSVESVQPYPELAADRQVFLSHLSSLTASDSAHSSLAASMSSILTDPVVGWKNLIIDSCFSKGLHRWMAERSWLIKGLGDDVELIVQDPANRAVDAEIDDFLRSEHEGAFTRDELVEMCKSK
ncbi:protein kinase-like domain-containingprotein [Purpureocillium lilacinum]|uniref:Protein kinase-like domain-containingprotein n=1 Tax=Purpureocillium lilacinum TaxID=33203 RepID=A0A179GLX5_PURLI|nr:protein kinase-like domain-containingprotein [Purpureocillium lilacinum]